MEVDFATLVFIGRGGTRTRRLDGVGNLVNARLHRLGEPLANEEAVEKRSGDKDRDAWNGAAVGIVHAYVWVSVDLPDSALCAIVVVVKGSE